MNGKWVARVRYRGEQVYLGRYETIEDAWARCHSVTEDELAKKRKGYRAERGVTKRDNKWIVNITVDGKRVYLGSRDSQEEGVALRDAALDRKRRGLPVLEKKEGNRYPGISWDKKTKKWNAYYLGDRKYNIGRYDTEEIAKDERDKWIKKERLWDLK